MKKILVISSIYPGPDVPKTFTPVVHYFTRQWVSMGYDVRVIHTSNYFPSVYYSSPKFIRNIFASRKGFALPEKRLNKEIDFDLDGVKVHRVPMMKIIPGRSFSKRVILKAEKKIISYLKDNDFKPAYMVGHWVIPQAELLYRLKQRYGCPTFLTLHDYGEPFRYCKNSKKLIDSIDVWGYRSLKIKEEFESAYGDKEFSFRCYSGIPTFFCDNVIERKWEKVEKFIFVGMLIERKHPDKLIMAVHDAYCNGNYSIDIIGDGSMSMKLNMLAMKLRCKDRVRLLGRLERQDIIKKLDNADVFVMISEHEVFGLVYLEAMARGCIVVASKNEGMQGIINDGENGFLCTAGNSNELCDIINRIKSLSPEELKRISKEAQNTAKRFTDFEVAKDYVEKIEMLGEKSKLNNGNKVGYNKSSLLSSGEIEVLRSKNN